MALQEIVEALEELTNEEFDSDDSSGDEKPEGFFCVEDSFLSSNVKVSVDGIGLIKYPITHDVIEKLIRNSEKAKFGRKFETVLDTSYRDTQMIPASKLKVDLNKQALNSLLARVGQDLHLEGQSQLQIHLYNMLIYGPGQFFKRHRDTEKVPNMVATLVMVLPSPHKGGDLVIEHHGLNHRFFGSLNNDIIKCITFYSDCYHEVKKVDEGYRVALTYNVELKSNINQSLVPVNDNLKDAVNNFFEESDKNDMLVYFLDHEYTENSLRWYMLKGADRICSKELLAVAKLEGYVPCLALADYQETWPEDCEDMVEKEITLYYWIDENNIRFESEKIKVSEDKICFMKDTKEEFSPYRREEEGNMGNYAGNIDEWYHRSCIVLWRSTWSFIQGFKIELNNLHQLTAQPGMEMNVLQKLNGPSQHFFSSTQFWNDASVKKMILDIMMYVNDKKTTYKILVNLKPSDVLVMTKNELVSWVADNFDIESWKLILKKWGSSCSSKEMLQTLLPFLSVYMAIENKDLEIAKYLFDETKKFFLNQKSSSYSYYSSSEGNKSGNDTCLCSLLKISFQLGRTDAEDDLINKAESKPSISKFKMFKEELHPEQFARIAGKLLLSISDSALNKVKKENYIYARPNQADIEEIYSLLETCVQLGNTSVEQKIFNYILSKPATFKPIFVAELLIKLAPILKDSCYYVDFKNRAFNMIREELEKLNRNPNDCSVPIQHPCSCGDCSKVQRFFASKTEMQLIIPTAKRNRAHIYSNLNPLAVYLPIKLETIRTGSPFKLTVTKLPKLLQDRRNLIQTLVQCKNKIFSTISSVGEPAAKKAKTL